MSGRHKNTQFFIYTGLVKIVSNPDFVVIGVFGDSILCGENLSYQGNYAIGDITVRDKNFSYIRTIMHQRKISEPYSEQPVDYYPRDFNYCGDNVFYRKFNETKGKYETFNGIRKLNVDTMPYSVAYAMIHFFIKTHYYKKALYYSY